MRITNTTDFDREFLRRMTAWCCRQLGHKPSWLKLAHFGTCCARRGFHGHAWHGEIRCMIPADNRRFPMLGCWYKSSVAIRPAPDGWPVYDIADRVEALVAITAHECEHVGQYENRADSSEKWTETEMVRVLEAFRSDRLRLMAEWSGIDLRLMPHAVDIVRRRAAKPSPPPPALDGGLHDFRGNYREMARFRASRRRRAPLAETARRAIQQREAAARIDALNR